MGQGVGWLVMKGYDGGSMGQIEGWLVMIGQGGQTGKWKIRMVHG